jgi:bacteriocin-like protein
MTTKNATNDSITVRTDKAEIRNLVEPEELSDDELRNIVGGAPDDTISRLARQTRPGTTEPSLNAGGIDGQFFFYLGSGI